MAMMTGDRVVVIEVTGVCNAAAHQTNYSVKATYKTMSNTVQRITRQGGKILAVTVPGSSPIVSETPEVSGVAEETQKKSSKSKRK